MVPSIETHLAQTDQKTQGISKAHYPIRTNMLTYGSPFRETLQTTTEMEVTLQRRQYKGLLKYYTVDGYY